eukprot:UN28201
MICPNAKYRELLSKKTQNNTCKKIFYFFFVHPFLLGFFRNRQ